MADVRGTMPLEEAAELRERLDTIARTVCPHDGRPAWTRHADALAALGRGESELVCECGRPNCDAAKRIRFTTTPHQTNTNPPRPSKST